MERGDVDFSVFLKQIATDPQIQTHVIIYYWIEMLKCVREIHNNGKLLILAILCFSQKNYKAKFSKKSAFIIVCYF